MDRSLGDFDEIRLPSPTVIVVIVAAIVAAIGLWSSYYTVEADEEVVLLRLGKFATIAEPGLHFKFPFGIDKALVVVKRSQEEEFGFRTGEHGVRTSYSSPDVEEESLMLTGDLNCAVVHWVVRYKISDSKAYVINVRDVEGTLRDVSEAVMRQIVGDRSIDEVIALARGEIAIAAQDQIQKALDVFGCGIHIEAVTLKDVTPPDAVKASFNAVNQARQQKIKTINEALTTKNSQIPAARGEAERLVKEAEGYKIKRINEAEGDTKRFLSILEEYEKAKDITKRRLYIETMEKILPQCGKKFLISEEQKGVLPLLQLRRQNDRGGASSTAPSRVR